MAKPSHVSDASAAVGSSHDENLTLVPGVTTIEGKIADALVIKDGNLFFLSEPDGAVPLSARHGFGLYYHDCRFLGGYEVTVGGRKPEVLVHNAEKGFMATLGLSNPDLHVNGSALLKHSVEIRWERVASGQDLALFDTIALQNLSSESISFPLA